MSKLSIEECLVILELPSYKSPSQLKTQYRKLANIHHPDKGGDENKFKILTEAYETLSSIPPLKVTNFKLDVSFLESLVGVRINTHVGIIDIPAGIRDKTKLSYNGNVIEINILSDPEYKREKDDIYTTKYISSLLAITGGEYTFIGPKGNSIVVDIPSLTDGGTILKIKGEGAPNVKDGIKGDLYIKLLLKTPVLTQDVIDAIMLASKPIGVST